MRARPASREELLRVHSAEYVDKIKALSDDSSKVRWLREREAHTRPPFWVAGKGRGKRQSAPPFSWPQHPLHLLLPQQTPTQGCHRAGDAMSFSPGAYEIAALAAGGAIELVDAVMASGGGAADANGGGGGAADANGEGAAAAAAAADAAAVTDAAAAVANGGGGAAAAGEAAAAASGGAGGSGGAYGLVRPPGHHAERGAGMG